MGAMKHCDAAVPAAAAAGAYTASIFISIRYIPTHACQPYEHRSATDLQLHTFHHRMPRANTLLS